MWHHAVGNRRIRIDHPDVESSECRLLALRLVIALEDDARRRLAGEPDDRPSRSGTDECAHGGGEIVVD